MTPAHWTNGLVQVTGGTAVANSMWKPTRGTCFLVRTEAQPEKADGEPGGRTHKAGGHAQPSGGGGTPFLHRQVFPGKFDGCWQRGSKYTNLWWISGGMGEHPPPRLPSRAARGTTPEKTKKENEKQKQKKGEKAKKHKKHEKDKKDKKHKKAKRQDAPSGGEATAEQQQQDDAEAEPPTQEEVDWGSEGDDTETQPAVKAKAVVGENGSDDSPPVMPLDANWPWGEQGRPSDMASSSGGGSQRPRTPSRSPRRQGGRHVELQPSPMWEAVQQVQLHMRKARTQ